MRVVFTYYLINLYLGQCTGSTLKRMAKVNLLNSAKAYKADYFY